MSNLSKQVEHECDSSAGCNAIELLLHPREKDLGGFSVRRVLPAVQRKMARSMDLFRPYGPRAI